MAFCNMCGTQIPDGSTTCAACASRATATPGGSYAAAAPAQGLTDNVAGMLAYITIIPAIVFLGLFDRPLGRWARPLLIFGRVPLFYYLLHIPLIHGAAVLVDYARFGRSPLAANGPWFKPEEMPEGYGVSLPVVYLIWIGVVLVLYLPCRWFAEVKRRHRDGWLSYM